MAATTPQFGPPALADPSFEDLGDTFHYKAAFHVATHGGPQRLYSSAGFAFNSSFNILTGKVNPLRSEPTGSEQPGERGAATLVRSEPESN
jgi:hypothetical protein